MIYTFENNTKIDLREIICIGSLEKDDNNNIVIPIHFRQRNAPIKIILGHAIAIASGDKKTKIKSAYNSFVMEWEKFKSDEYKAV